MQVSLDTAKACIAAMAVLYNMKLDFDNDWDYDDADDEDGHDPDPEPDQQHAEPTVRGNLFRQRFVQEHFA